MTRPIRKDWVLAMFSGSEWLQYWVENKGKVLAMKAPDSPGTRVRIERKRSILAKKKGAIGLAIEMSVDASLEDSFGKNDIPTGTLNFFPRIDDILRDFVVGGGLTDLILNLCSDELRLKL